MNTNIATAYPQNQTCKTTKEWYNTKKRKKKKRQHLSGEAIGRLLGNKMILYIRSIKCDRA